MTILRLTSDMRHPIPVTAQNHSMALLLGHEEALVTSGGVSLALGLALATNMSWHLQGRYSMLL